MLVNACSTMWTHYRRAYNIYLTYQVKRSIRHTLNCSKQW